MLVPHDIKFYPFIDYQNKLYFKEVSPKQFPELYTKYGLDKRSNQIMFYITQLLYCNFVIMSNSINKLNLRVQTIHNYL